MSTANVSGCRMSLCRSSAGFLNHYSYIAETGSPHHTAHFHACGQDEIGIFSIDPVELIAGSLPRKQRRLVEAWAELHQAELATDWQRLQEGRRPAPIEPLK